MTVPEISVVIPAHNESRTIGWTIESIVTTLDAPFEIIVIDDRSTDATAETAVAAARRGDARLRIVRSNAPLGVANARNLGALESHGELIMFLDAHCQLLPGWYDQVRHAFDATGASLLSPAVGSIREGASGTMGYGVRWKDPAMDMEWMPRKDSEPYLVPLICGCCQIVRRAAFFELGGYDPMMTRWGTEDHEICLRAWLFGHTVAVAPDAQVLHLFREAQPYTVDWELVTQNLLRCALVHFTGERLEHALREQTSHRHFASSLERTMSDDTARRRESYLANRLHDDAWYFDELVPALSPRRSR